MPAGARRRARDPRRRRLRRKVVCQSRIGAQSENIVVFFPALLRLFLFSLLHHRSSRYLSLSEDETISVCRMKGEEEEEEEVHLSASDGRAERRRKR